MTEKKAANAEDNEGYTPLHWATQSKSKKLVPYAYSWNTELMSRGKQERIVTHHLIYKPRSGVIVRKGGDTIYNVRCQQRVFLFVTYSIHIPV